MLENPETPPLRRGLSTNPSGYPLFTYFLAAYLSTNNKDLINFPPDEFPGLLQRYEAIFENALSILCMRKETLKARSEFNFDSGDALNLEGGLAILRVVAALNRERFGNITLVRPSKNARGADLTCEKNGYRVCCEVKTITKQSQGRKDHYFADQLYEKMLESIDKARDQLDATACELGCSIKLLVYVVNWFAHSIYLDKTDYQYITNRLEQDQDQRSLVGIDGVFFVTKMGQCFLFLNEHAKCIDV